VIDQEAGIAQSLVNDTSRVKRMESFATVLKNQHFGTIVDARNCSAKARCLGPKAFVATIVGNHEIK
jgi:hypothetical protein